MRRDLIPTEVQGNLSYGQEFTNRSEGRRPWKLVTETIVEGRLRAISFPPTGTAIQNRAMVAELAIRRPYLSETGPFS